MKTAGGFGAWTTRICVVLAALLMLGAGGTLFGHYLGGILRHGASASKGIFVAYVVGYPLAAAGLVVALLLRWRRIQPSHNLAIGAVAIAMLSSAGFFGLFAPVGLVALGLWLWGLRV